MSGRLMLRNDTQNQQQELLQSQAATAKSMHAAMGGLTRNTSTVATNTQLGGGSIVTDRSGRCVRCGMFWSRHEQGRQAVQNQTGTTIFRLPDQ